MSKVPKGIMVAIPSNGRRPPFEWGMALATLSYPVGMNHFLYVSKKNPNDTSMTRDKQRNTLAEKALALGCEYMFFLDDDTVPPAHAVQSLWYVLSQNPKAAICGGIYCTREANPSPLVFKEIGAGPCWDWTLGDVFKCKGLGTGCMLIRTSVLKSLERPWFKDTSDCEPGRTEKIGETEVTITGSQGTDDIYFCQKVLAAGWDILAHGGVLPAHIGEDDTQYVLPNDCPPVLRYMKKKEEFAAIGQDARNREQKVSE